MPDKNLFPSNKPSEKLFAHSFHEESVISVVNELLQGSSYSERDLRQLNIRLSSHIGKLPEKDTILLLQRINETSELMYGRHRFLPDLRTMTSLMNRLQTFKLHHLVYDVYNYLLSNNYELDLPSLVVICRSLPIRSKKKTLLRFLQFHYPLIGKNIVTLVNTLISQYKYINIPSHHQTSDAPKQTIQLLDLDLLDIHSIASERLYLHPNRFIMDKSTILDTIYALYTWLEKNNLLPTIETMNAMLSVISKYGDVSHRLSIERDFLRYNLSYNLKTYNILINDCASRSSDPAQQLFAFHSFNELISNLQLQLTSQPDLAMDETIYFGILKLLIVQNDYHNIVKIIQHMKDIEMPFNFHLHLLLTKYFHSRATSDYTVLLNSSLQSSFTPSSITERVQSILSSILQSQAIFNDRIVPVNSNNSDRISLRFQPKEYITRLIQEILSISPTSLQQQIGEDRVRSNHYLHHSRSVVSPELLSELIEVFIPKKSTIVPSFISSTPLALTSEIDAEKTETNIRIQKVILALLLKAKELEVYDFRTFLSAIQVFEKRQDFEGIKKVMSLMDRYSIQWKPFGVRDVFTMIVELLQSSEQGSNRSLESEKELDHDSLVPDRQRKESGKDLLFYFLPFLQKQSMMIPNSITSRFLVQLLRASEYSLILDLVELSFRDYIHRCGLHLSSIVQKAIFSLSRKIQWSEDHTITESIATSQRIFTFLRNFDSYRDACGNISIVSEESNSRFAQQLNISTSILFRLLPTVPKQEVEIIQNADSRQKSIQEIIQEGIRLISQSHSEIRPSSRIYYQLDQGLLFHLINLCRTYQITEPSLYPIFSLAIERGIEVNKVMISSILSFLYSEGKLDDVVELYELFYRKKLINHWVYPLPLSSPALRPNEDVQKNQDKNTKYLLNLHDYNRGMAFAAVKTALSEISNHSHEVNGRLVIITGKNYPSVVSPDVINYESSQIDGETALGDSFRLVNEVQSVLIEHFYPSIPSTTAPNNLGRIVLSLGDIRLNKSKIDKIEMKDSKSLGMVENFLIESMRFAQQQSAHKSTRLPPVAMLEPVKLSLATFQPDKCYPPYLNTPRSLEACRMNGVNPMELVEIPFSEFQRDFPNDVDAAKRRYERIDGARRRILENVKKDWKHLCETNWKPTKVRPRSAKESILPVAPAAHCTLLELQAAKFRKIERENWEELQRKLKLEIVKADQEVQNKKILQKHDNIQEKRDAYVNEHRMKLQELHREELLRRVADEQEELEEIKNEQQEFQKEIIQKSQQEKEAKRQEKLRREQQEYERVQRMKYTKQVKDSIFQGLEAKYEMRKQMSELRAKNNEDRLQEFFERQQREREMKLKDLDNKLDHVKMERERLAEENRKATLDKIMAHERHRQEVEAMRLKYKTEIQPQEQNQSYEKFLRIKERNENWVKAKADRTLQTLHHKDDIAKREMEKIQEAQERRRAIKAIRQEAHEIALLRAKKMEEYRLAKIKESIKNKEDRTMAIRQGFHILDHMRNTMKDIMVKTNAELKNEMDRLRHVDQFSPDKVAVKAMEVSNQVLFPRLQSKFGIETHEDDPMRKLFATTGGINDTEKFGFDLGSATQPLTELDTNPLYEGDRTVLTEDPNRATANKTKRGVSATTSRSHSRGHSAPAKSLSPNRDAATLQIQALTQDNLKNSLLQSIKRVESLHTSQSMTSMKAHSPKRRKHKDGHHDGEAYDDSQGYPTPILKLKNDDGSWEEEDSQTRSKHSSLSKGTAGHNSLESSDKSRGRSRKSFRGDNPNRRGSSISPDHSLSSTKQMTRNTEENNNDIPIFEFTAGEEYKKLEEEKDPKNRRRKKTASNTTTEEDKGEEKDEDGRRRSRSGSRRRRRAAADHQKKQEALRTDKNEKAKFGKLPPGKFRREFSLDHPLAPNGKGKYTKELQQGLKPVGLFVNPIKRANEDIEETINLAAKMEKLTYEAQTTILERTTVANTDDKTITQHLEELKKELDAKLADLLEEERIAEEGRLEAIKNVTDPQEKYNLELIFAEERQRASDRIIAVTKDNDTQMKQALLKTMNLGNYLSAVESKQ